MSSWDQFLKGMTARPGFNFETFLKKWIANKNNEAASIALAREYVAERDIYAVIDCSGQDMTDYFPQLGVYVEATTCYAEGDTFDTFFDLAVVHCHSELSSSPLTINAYECATWTFDLLSEVWFEMVRAEIYDRAIKVFPDIDRDSL